MEQIKESLSVLWISPARDDLSRVLWCIFVAVLLCGIYLIYRRATVGKALGLLTEKGCFSPESAKTAEELGLKNESALTADAHLIKRLDGEKKRYYIPEELKKKAEYMQKAGTAKWWHACLGILGLYLVLVILYHILPDLIGKF
ncbi:MAG: hypothetical protein IKT50_02490 [Clostridia bacterium]|nr:hypothetical protein [Clostridia bacterium]